MEGSLNYQRDIYSRISKAYTNFRKSPKERITDSYVETRLDNVEQLWNKFLITHQQITKDYKWEDVQSSFYAKEELYDKTEETYVEYKSILKKYLKTFEQSNVNSNDKGSGSLKNSGGSSVKLPKITIPTFSGKYTEWMTFRDMFISLVHSNNSLDDVQKLHYLKGHLTGEAEQLIRQIPVTSANYIQCWQQLENRFNNKRYLANCILKRLFSQRNTSVETATALKDLLDTTTDCLFALKNLGIDVSTWDIIVIHIVNYKLDSETRKQWELKVSADSSNELPTFTQFSDFLQSRFRALECLEPKQRLLTSSSLLTSKAKSLHVANLLCEFCSENHKLCFCKKFAILNFNQRHEFVSKNRLCYNCLGGNHSVKSCRITVTCRICKKRHHSLLHPTADSGGGNTHDVSHNALTSLVDGNDSSVTRSTEETSILTGPVVSCFASGQIPLNSQVLLATALVRAETANGESRVIRALLDQGSQASFVTEATAQYLGVKKIPVRGLISGLEGNKNITAKYMVQLKIHSRIKPEAVFNVQAYVLKTITTFLPRKRAVELDWLNTNEIQLADPQYHTPNKIDLLLGAEIYGQVIESGIRKGPNGTLVAQATSLGWILSGLIDSLHNYTTNIIAMHVCSSDNDFLRRFWELESELNLSQKIMTEEEIRCEEFYTKTTQRDVEGRYVVRLPFKDDVSAGVDGGSRDMAVKRLKALISRLNKDENLKENYKNVIAEYLQMNHMEKVPETEKENSKTFYLPHHAVVREDKETTKLRVVYDASAKNKNGTSLNDMLMIGPTIQPELRHLIMRWRMHKICLAADIIKMYRQVKVAQEDTDFQRLVWKSNLKDDLTDYRLTRVTFGTAAAPYLAVRSLHQVALDDGAHCPRTADRVRNDFYMDDLLTGCNSVEEGVIIYKEMNQLLKGGGFELQKWMSNSEEVLNEINHGKEETQKGLQIKLDAVVKLLGLTWDRAADVFRYSVTLNKNWIETGPVTKRKIISQIAKLYDPLGWAAPSVIVAKTLIQKLWIAGIEWDEEVPSNLAVEWDTYRIGLPKLEEVHVPRWLGIKLNESRIELHGFSDASKIAYSAVVYIRIVDREGNVRVSLVTAKTRVAPIKQISIPRLELCGAVLVTRLLIEVAEVMGIDKDNIRAWTDSTVVLAWLNSHPSKWQTFVANRVSEILTTLNAQQWSHITSGQNPADCASRGVHPSDLSTKIIWFNGPEFLSKDVILYSKSKNIETHLEETKVHFAVTEPTLWDKYSTLTKLIRVVAYCKRFLNILKRDRKQRGTFLTTQELSDALNSCVKLCQDENFNDEITLLKKMGQNCKIKGTLKSLNPYIDNDGILRVGGRLEKSQLSHNARHPMLLPKKSHLTNLIISDAHSRTMHGGQQLMLAFLGTKYYILGAKPLVKAHVRKCVKCIRFTAPTSTQLMGQLPTARVSPSKPFQCSGVDYAGPINVRTTKGRGRQSTKGYICLFVCMATRAVHLEVVSDLTTQGFLASYKRFVARRGVCTDLWSDNATNFKGASRELRSLINAENSRFSQEVAECLATNGTAWHFIPPRSPNFGGLWEAGIRSTKYHLKRVIGELTLTYEELSTVLAQVEACLNSRPLSRIDSESDALDVLTPGHFLVGGPLITVPDHNFEQSNVANLRRWQLTQKLMQTFWKRWSQEYLAHFLHRYKWSNKNPEPEIGDVVLVKEDDLPPCRWLLGRVVAKHPGKDNVTRVVTLRNQNSIIKRPTSKLCVLPVSN